MKKAMNNTKKITIALITMVTMGFSQGAMAGIKIENPVEVKLIHSEKNKPLFQLNMNNNEADEFYVRVKDGAGNVLYSETLKGIKVWRRYLLDVEDEDFNDSNFKLQFEVTGKKTQKTVKYNVTRDTRIVDDISIAKL